MTKAVFFRSPNGSIKGFRINGHAGARKAGDYDLVCAAVSAVGFTALGALDELCGVKDYQESDGNLQMMLPEGLAPDVAGKAQIILETMEIGLVQVEKQYPKYVHVLNREV